MDDLDDLFTDQLNDQINEQISKHISGQLTDQLNAQLEITTPPALPPGLQERLDQLRLSGCSQKLAWSRMGAIAYITSDRRDVKISCLQFKGKEFIWGLSDYTDYNLAPRSRFPYGLDLTHVTWSPQGTDLLIIDSTGRIALGIVLIALNRLIPITKPLNVDPEDNLNAVVGLKWLESKRRVYVPRGAEKVDGTWKYLFSAHEAKGPHHPLQKLGFLVVTKGAYLKLFYQSLSEWVEAKEEIDGISSSEDILTHADLCSDKDDTLLLVVHTASRQLKLYSVKIDWQLSKPNELSANPATLTLQHLTTLDMCGPSLNAPEVDGFVILDHSRELELSHLKLLPRPPDVQDEASVAPTVLAVFSYVPNVLTDAASSYSIISRWEICEEKPTVDSSFTQLSTKKSTSTELKMEYVLNRLEDIRVERTLVFLEQIYAGRLYAFGYSDGDMEFRDRSMSLLSVEDMPDKASTLTAMGFSFDKVDPCLHMALSPHGTVKATFGKVHELKISHLNLPIQLIAPDTLDKVTASFVLQHTVSEVSFNMGNNATDDLLMTMWHFERHFTPSERKQMDINFMKDLYRMLSFLDKCADIGIERLLRFPPFGRALSMQGALGHQSDKTSRWSLTAKVAFTLQSLRLIALSLSFALLKPGQAHTAGAVDLEINKPEILQYITTQVGWMITLCDYVLDQLFEAARLFAYTSSTELETLSDKTDAPSYPSLLLLLCTVCRGYIRYNCRLMRNLLPLFQSPAAAPPSPLAPYYANLSTTMRSAVVHPSQLDLILEVSEPILAETYASLSEAQRQEIELSLLAAGTIPPVLLPALHKILSGPVEAMRARMGDAESELAFRDWSAVSLGRESEESVRRKKEAVYDGVRKVEVSRKKVRTRVCLRCEGHMEDLIPGRNQKGWLWNMMRTCYCGGNWVVERPVEG